MLLAWMPNILGVVLDLESAEGSLDLSLICPYLPAVGLEVHASIEHSTRLLGFDRSY
jgi:hypothetical protein